jgi:hypothetical protein
VDCHTRQEARLAANRDFGEAHAPFRLAVFDGKKETTLREDAPVPPTEKSGMKFSHAAHLKAEGVSSPEGQTILGCTSCHRPDESGQGFKPPQMESGCQQSGCHRARFAEPMRGVVPHANVRELMDRMRTFFAARLADDPALNFGSGVEARTRLEAQAAACSTAPTTLPGIPQREHCSGNPATILAARSAMNWRKPAIAKPHGRSSRSAGPPTGIPPRTFPTPGTRRSVQRLPFKIKLEEGGRPVDSGHRKMP